MSARSLLVALIVAATAAFVVGVAIERNSGEPGGERAAVTEAGESGGETHETGGETHESAPKPELRPLGIDVEAAPFVALAAAASLALALAAWLRPATAPLLLFVAAAMLVFAALDVREIAHQIDESRAGVAVLAGTVALLHAGAAAVAASMTRPLSG